MTNAKRFVLMATAPLALLGACKPDLGNPPSLVDRPRILAVRGTPAEASQGQDVTYDVLAVNPQGRIVNPATKWATCHEPKPPAQINAVSTVCLTIADEAGPSPTFKAAMPDNACKVFGPQPPEVEAGKPPLRPRDPDVTGGFYQPVRAFLETPDGDYTAFALERLRCPLANAPQDVTAMFNMLNKTPNTNPTIASVTLDPDGDPVALSLAGPGGTPSAAPTVVFAGGRYTLRVAWPETSPEPFPVWNILKQALEMHRESLSVSWFTTAGEFVNDSTGRGELETESCAGNPDLLPTCLTTINDWTAPATPGVVSLWAVLRDNRGGVDFAEVRLEVQ